MAQYDLTLKLCPFLDRHLTIPLLEFLEMRETYDNKQILKAKYALLQKTNMVDYAGDMYKAIHDTNVLPPEMLEKRTSVIDELTRWKKKCNHFMEVTGRDDVLDKLGSDRIYNMEYLRKNYQITDDTLEDVYQLSMCSYSAGNYTSAAEYLTHYRVLSNDGDKMVSALWGKFAAEILEQKWDEALEDMYRLKEVIDAKQASGQAALQQLHQRAWLIHWSLFVFFNHEKGRDAIIDLFMQPQYINTIQAVCPHVLRYLTTAVITNRRRRHVVRDLVRVIQQESHRLNDPITELMDCLFGNFDFDGAQQKIRECELVLADDFFLVSCRDEFIENARLFIFETYCRIHKVISIDMLSQKLNMSQDDAEVWIVQLIRNARLDAKINSQEGTVIMGTPIASVYQQIIEMTSYLTLRSNVLAENVSRRMGAAPGKFPREAAIVMED